MKAAAGELLFAFFKLLFLIVIWLITPVGKDYFGRCYDNILKVVEFTAPKTDSKEDKR